MEARIMAETIAWILKNKGHGIWSVPSDATVYDAIAMMADKGGRGVARGRRGNACGDHLGARLCPQSNPAGTILNRHPVQEIMTRSLITVTPEDTAEECMRIMTQRRVRHVPVLENSKLVGIVSIGDLVKAIISDQAHTIDPLHTYITNKYPA
jgi:CBS domain-containing protein